MQERRLRSRRASAALLAVTVVALVVWLAASCAVLGSGAAVAVPGNDCPPGHRQVGTAFVGGGDVPDVVPLCVEGAR